MKKSTFLLLLGTSLLFWSCSQITDSQTIQKTEDEAQQTASSTKQDSKSTSSTEEESKSLITSTFSFNADNLSEDSYTSNFTLGNYTVYATSAKSVSVASSSQTFGSKTFSKALNLSGKGSVLDYRCISFETTGEATVSVYASGAEDRPLALYKSDGELVTSFNTSSSIALYEFNVTESGTYCLMSQDSGIKIYCIETAVSTTDISSGNETTQEPSSADSSLYIKISDTPTGYASITTPSKSITVSNRSDFIKYATEGEYIVYVDGMIDLSNGYLPESAGGSNTNLDSLVNSNTSGAYTTYDSFKEAYAKSCITSTNDKSSSSPESSLGSYLWACNSAYGNIIKVNIASNTQIIGLTQQSGIKGGMLNISSVSNVAVRNMIIQDAYDPFPHHEKDDGYNAQWDCIVIQGTSSNI